MPTYGPLNTGKAASADYQYLDTRNPNQVAGDVLSQAGGYRLRGSPAEDIQKGLNTAKTRKENPYDLGIGNQNRDQYLAALDALHNGPSLINSQAAAAMGANREAMAQGAARGNSQALLNNRAGVDQLAQVATDAGSARLAEYMQQQAQYGAGINTVRAQDQQQQQSFNRAGLQGRGQNDALAQFYNDLQVKDSLRQQQQALKEYMTRQRLARQNVASGTQTAKDVAGAVASLFG
jgi:hypothetical protein